MARRRGVWVGSGEARRGAARALSSYSMQGEYWYLLRPPALAPGGAVRGESGVGSGRVGILGCDFLGGMGWSRSRAVAASRARDQLLVQRLTNVVTLALCASRYEAS